ncbi:hypothetical protein [Campylobacter sp. RM12651]|uniref:hypothetical protein n=1 Tax=Campylobacter sp. RM12651 TaxID=1660079 RepID=UPI001EFB7233|nr:hypothetical protein [Campylobacter sp. RM12651]ULO04580.1 hypothetical protein AVBRAN_a0098 [Campylobacter sp. RM12651]
MNKKLLEIIEEENKIMLANKKINKDYELLIENQESIKKMIDYNFSKKKMIEIIKNYFKVSINPKALNRFIDEYTNKEI